MDHLPEDFFYPQHCLYCGCPLDICECGENDYSSDEDFDEDEEELGDNFPDLNEDGN